MDITLDHKTDQTITFTYYNTNGTTPRDLTGCTVYFTVKASKYSTVTDDTDALISKDVASHTNPTGGVTSIVLTNSQTNVAPNTHYFYDIKVKEADSKVYLAQSGNCTITPSPTNRA